MRLRTQVIRADPETTLWSESFERPAEEVLALESSFATALAAAINVQLSPSEQTRMSTTKTVEPAAYEAYLQGRFWAGKHSAENFRKAQGYFERAIAIDPGFAAAWASLAAIHHHVEHGRLPPLLSVRRRSAVIATSTGRGSPRPPAGVPRGRIHAAAGAR